MEKQATPEKKLGPGAGTTAGSPPGSQSPAHVPAPPASSPHPPHPGQSPSHPTVFVGAQLAPVLQQACEGRLDTITWFRTDWQRGGALTGYATYRDDDGRDVPVVVKLPVPPRERRWLVRLQSADHVVPKLYRHGEELGSYDMAWLVMERLPHGPLGHAWSGAEFDLLVEAAGRFYHAANDVPLTGEPMRKDWQAVYDKARKHVDLLPGEQRWRQAFKKAHRHLRDWAARWEDRAIDHWVHGDLHLANALTRRPAPGGPAVLIDFAEVRPGHWLEDAVYLEHLFWARRQRLDGRRLCSQVAHERKRHGLHVEPNWPDLAQIRRALLAISTPAMLEHDGDPHHVQASLEVLEAIVGR